MSLLFDNSGQPTADSERMKSALTGGKRSNRNASLFGAERGTSSAYREALQGIHQTAPHGGSLRFEPSNEVQRKIEAVIRKYRLNGDMFGNTARPSYDDFGPAFVWMMAAEYPSLVCTSLSKKALKTKVSEEGTFFETSTLTKLQSTIKGCKANFVIIPIQSGTVNKLKFEVNQTAADTEIKQFALIQTNVSPPTIEFFSPLTDFTGFDKLGDLVGKDLRRQLGAKIRAIPPMICPEISENAPTHKLSCILWTLYYFSLRIAHPEMSTESIVSEVKGSFDKNAGSSREDFLAFISALYDYWSRSKKIDKFNWSANDIAKSRSQMKSIIQVGLQYGSQLWQAYWKLITSFPLCRCVPTKNLDSKEYCLDLDQQVTTNDSKQILLFRRAMSECQDSRLFLLTLGSQGKRKAGFILFDKLFNVYYSFNYASPTSLAQDDPPQNFTSQPAPPSGAVAFIDKASNNPKSPTLILDTEFLPDLPKDLTSVQNVWSEAIKDDRNLPGVVNGICKTLDVMFLYYLRIKYPQNNLFTIRDVDANDGQERIRSEFHKELLKIAGEKSMKRKNDALKTFGDWDTVF